MNVVVRPGINPKATADELFLGSKTAETSSDIMGDMENPMY